MHEASIGRNSNYVCVLNVASNACVYVRKCTWLCVIVAQEIQLPPGSVVSGLPWSFRWRRSAQWAQLDHGQNNSPQVRGLLLGRFIKLNSAMF